MYLEPTTTMRRSYSSLVSKIPSESILTTGPGISLPIASKLNITLILLPLSVFALCMVAGLAGICILSLLIWKKRKENSIANEINQTSTYYEVIDPIYETVPSTESENLTDNFGITTTSNDAYNSIHSQEKKCRHSPPLDFNTSSNEAYVPSEKVIALSMQHNSSYQTAAQFSMITESEGPTDNTQ